MKQKFIRIAYLYSKCTDCRIKSNVTFRNSRVTSPNDQCNINLIYLINIDQHLHNNGIHVRFIDIIYSRVNNLNKKVINFTHIAK